MIIWDESFDPTRRSTIICGRHCEILPAPVRGWIHTAASEVGLSGDMSGGRWPTVSEVFSQSKRAEAVVTRKKTNKSPSNYPMDTTQTQTSAYTYRRSP